MKDRYFLLFYDFKNKTTMGSGNGYCTVSVSGGKYINQNDAAGYIQKQIIDSEYAAAGDIISVIFKNIIELSKEDYNSWSA